MISRVFSHFLIFSLQETMFHYHQRHQKEEYAPYKCEDCEKTFLMSEEFNAHRINEHHKLDILKYSCQLCPCVFYEKSKFLVHENLHGLNEKVFLCKCCNEGFTNRLEYMFHYFLKHYSPNRKNPL